MGRAYIYGIVRSRSEEDLSIVGVDGTNGVRLVASHGLGCLLSDYDGGDPGGLSRERLVRCLLAHQRVVEHAMQREAVLPVKFGTILENSKEARALLSQGRADFQGALAFIQDKVQVEVAVTWDVGRVLRELSQEPEVSHARDTLARHGQVGVAERIQLGQLVKARLDKRRASYRKCIVGVLGRRTVASVANALLSDEMVVNTAFLVQRERYPEFEAGVQLLDGILQDDITFRVIGPLPTYSFSTVEVKRLTRDEIAQARQILGLGETISAVEIRKAYRRLAAQAQTIAAPNSGEERLARLRQASEALLACSNAAGRGAAGAAGTDSIFVVTIKGAAGDEVEASRFGGQVGA